VQPKRTVESVYVSDDYQIEMSFLFSVEQFSLDIETDVAKKKLRSDNIEL
jgi:hypothetical protein